MELADTIVTKIMGDLYERGGFDEWWDSVDEEVQSDIFYDLTALVADILVKNHRERH